MGTFKVLVIGQTVVCDPGEALRDSIDLHSGRQPTGLLLKGHQDARYLVGSAL